MIEEIKLKEEVKPTEEVEEKVKPDKVKQPKKKPKIETRTVEKTPDGIIVHYSFDTGEKGKMSFGYPFTKASIMEALKRRYKEREQAKKLDVSKFEGIKIMEVK